MHSSYQEVEFGLHVLTDGSAPYMARMRARVALGKENIQNSADDVPGCYISFAGLNRDHTIS